MSKLKITAGIKKLLRILLWGVTGMLLLVGTLYVFLQMPAVQTFLVKYITERVEETTGVHIEVGGVDFRPMRSLVLNDVLLKDFKEDTLLYCRDLRVKADSFNWLNRSFQIREVVLDEACFHLWISRGEGNSATNIEMFIDSLRKERTALTRRPGSTAQQNDWLMNLQKVVVRRSHFTYREEEFEPTDYGVNWTDVDCRDLNVELSNFDFTDESTSLTVAGLNFIEKSGLEIKNMGGQVRMWDDHLLITDCRFEMGQSDVDLVKLEFRWTPNQHDWRYFTSRMKQYYELGPSAISFVDLAYFNGILRGINNTVKCSGVVSNTIRELEGHDLYFELGEGTVFQGSFRSKGLPDVWNTVFDIELHKAHLAPRDLETVYLPWFKMNIPVPTFLYPLPYVDFEKIKFNGTLEDFLVEAKSVTPALAGELSFRYAPCQLDSSDCSAMSGEFRFRQVDCRKLSGFSFLGNAVISGNYAGRWDEQGLTMHVNSRIRTLNLRQGQLRNLEIGMVWEKEKLDLIATLNDRKATGGWVMSYESSDTLDFLSAKGQLKINDLAAFGLGIKSGEESVRAAFNLVHAGQAEKSFSNLTFFDVQYARERDSFYIPQVGIEDNRLGEYNTTTLRSEVVDLSITGKYRKLRPLPFVFQLVQNYLPAYSTHREAGKRARGTMSAPGFRSTICIKDADRVLRVLYPDLKLSPGMTVVTNFDQENKKLHLSLSADTIVYKSIRLLQPAIKLAGDAEQLKINYAADRIVYGDGYQLYNVRNQLQLQDNHLDNEISWCNWENATYSGHLAACVIFTPQGKEDYKTEIRIRPGVIVMNDSVWRVNESSIYIEGKNVQVDSFSIRRGKEFLSVEGKIAENPEEKLYINLENFNLENFTRITLNRRPAVVGMATGSLTVQDYYRDFLLISDFKVEQWGINRDTLGILHFRSYWDAENRSLMVGAKNQIGEHVPLSVSGYYTPSSDTLNVNVHLEKVGLERLNPYVSEYVSEMKGFLSGNMMIAGTSRQPDLSGFVCLDSVGLKVNALNTNFFIHDSLPVEHNRLILKDVILRDTRDHLAVVNGEYQVTENRYHLNTRFQNFQVLNTGFADNESFYGQVYLSGAADLNNQEGRVNMTVNARTENESYLYLPLSESVIEQNNNFLHFLNAEQPESPKKQTASAWSDINLNANLELNDHLNIQVIFDPTVGDILRAAGNGDIKIDFDKDGNLTMFGEYRITRGDYLFTLSNLVNKKFVLTPGGTISWNGSPYDAMLNINAVYNLKTAITELLPTERVVADESGADEKTTSESGRKVPVECILNLSDNLNNPTVKFDINFPTLETQSKSYIQSLFSSQDEINKQMFSLLVLNRFYRPDNMADYGTQAQAASVTTITEMMSNQLSRWVSEYSSNVDIGFAFRARDPDREVSTNEIELALSTQLLNDRITISANGNMDVGGAKNTAGEESRKTNIAGDFDIEVKLNKQGSLKMKAYSHTDEKLLYNNTETIQGVGISYQESFDTFRELLRKYFSFFRQKSPKN